MRNKKRMIRGRNEEREGKTRSIGFSGTREKEGEKGEKGVEKRTQEGTGIPKKVKVGEKEC